jgi:uncharacterized protein (DUF1778 family)
MIGKSARLEARLSQSHQSLIQRAAAMCGQSVTDFVVSASLAQARRTIAENESLELSAAEQRRFANALLKPKPPSKGMKKAAAAHQRLVEPS